MAKAGDGMMGSSCQWGEVSLGGDENDLELDHGIIAWLLNTPSAIP